MEHGASEPSGSPSARSSPQSERKLRVRGGRHETPDAKKVRAFIGLALAEPEARAEAEAAQRSADAAENEGERGRHESP